MNVCIKLFSSEEIVYNGVVNVIPRIGEYIKINRQFYKVQHIIYNIKNTIDNVIIFVEEIKNKN